MEFKGIEIIHAERVIPPGPYCYRIAEPPTQQNDWLMRTVPCRFHRLMDKHPSQANGYCTYLRRGDLEQGALLRDGVKECGIKDHVEEVEF